ncbi:MAG: tRNA threonylcarbamoyladenosine dehydratase [Clostridia bacterium]|nr:tRNA threonylcarbamoyladenosine dehydratase [Clostridia bacterium]
MDSVESIYTRTEAMLGKDAVDKLRSSRILIVGVGGVGGHAAEAIARAGVGGITVIDHDTVSVTNLNRQIIATVSGIGKSKVELIKQRIVDINPECKVETLDIFYDDSTKDMVDISRFDYVLDCIDSVRSKLLLIERAIEAGVPIISSMGTGNKLDPTRFKITDISKTHTDPLAKSMRVELRKRGINHLRVLFSDEPPISSSMGRTPGSVSFMPSVAGLIMAGEAIREIIKPPGERAQGT